MTLQIQNTHTSSAHTRYVHALTNAYIQGSRIYDPSFALNRDFEIYEKLRRDPVINHAVEYRKHLVAGKKIIVEPATDDDKDVAAAEVMEQLTKRMFNYGASRFNLSEAFLTGSNWGFINGSLQDIVVGQDKKPRRWWVPTRIKNQQRLRVIGQPEENAEGRIIRKLLVWNIQKRDFVPLEHPEWYVKHVYDDVEESLGFGRGLIDALYFVWWAKAIIWNEGLGAAERWGRGMLIAKIDGTIPATLNKGNEVLRSEFLSELEKHQSRHILAFDKRHDISVVPGPGQGWQILEFLLNYCDNAMRTLILGASVPTSPQEGGSFALAKVQENSTEALVQFDRELLSETLTRDFLGLTWKLNMMPLRQMGLGGAQMPAVRIINEKIEDPLKEAQVASTLLGANVPLKEEEVYTKTGYTMPGPGDRVIKPQPRPAPPPPLGGPLGGI